MKWKRRSESIPTLPFFNVTKLEYIHGKAHLRETRRWAFIWRTFMFDAQKILQQVLGGQQGGSSQKTGGMISSDHVTGAAVGGLAGLLLGSKSARKIAGPVAQLGGIAAVGTLAYQAWQTWQSKQNGQALPPPSSAEGTVFLPQNPVMRNDASLMVLSAMIAAAKADGHIDAGEQEKIFAKLDEESLSSEEKAFLMDQFRRPLNIAELAASAKTPEQNAEIYTASVMAIQPDTATEITYLNNLATALGLDPGLRSNIDAVVKSA
jgi:uncharacterized membrane protein YebE (DUF533 family)